MLESLRDKIYSVVQDGINKNNIIRQKLSEVQAINSKSLSLNRRVLNSKSENINYAAGTALLEKYQKDWSDIRSSSEENASKAAEADRMIADLLALQTKKLVSYCDLSYSLANLSKISLAVDECTNLFYSIDTLIEEIDNKLTELEDLVEIQELEKRKREQHLQLAKYKEVKLSEMERVRQAIAKESAKAAADQERETQRKQEERRMACQLAFQDDMEAFKRSGIIGTRVERVEKAAHNQLTLEQIELDANNTELDEFLNG